VETQDEHLDPCQDEEAACEKARSESRRLAEITKAYATTKPLGTGDCVGAPEGVGELLSAAASAKRNLAEANRALAACRLAHRPSARPRLRAGSDG
jgi:hypothetical protein